MWLKAFPHFLYTGDVFPVWIFGWLIMVDLSLQTLLPVEHLHGLSSQWIRWLRRVEPFRKTILQLLHLNGFWMAWTPGNHPILKLSGKASWAQCSGGASPRVGGLVLLEVTAVRAVLTTLPTCVRLLCCVPALMHNQEWGLILTTGGRFLQWSPR